MHASLFSAPFLDKTRRFAKTGSGQTSKETDKRDRFVFSQPAMIALARLAGSSQQSAGGGAPLGLGPVGIEAAVRQKFFCVPFYTKTEDLPRQARDNHRERWEKENNFSAGAQHA